MSKYMNALVLVLIGLIVMGVTVFVLFMFSSEELRTEQAENFYLSLAVLLLVEAIIVGYFIVRGLTYVASDWDATDNITRRAIPEGAIDRQAKVPSFTISVFILVYAALAVVTVFFGALLAGGIFPWRTNLVIQVVLLALFLVPSLLMNISARSTAHAVSLGLGKTRDYSQFLFDLSETQTALERAPDGELKRALAAVSGLKDFAAGQNAKPQDPELEDELVAQGQKLKSLVADLATRPAVEAAQVAEVEAAVNTLREMLRQRSG